MTTGPECAPGLDEHDHAVALERRRRLPRRADEEPAPHGNRPEVGTPGVGPRLVGKRGGRDGCRCPRDVERREVVQVVPQGRGQGGRLGAGREERAEGRHAGRRLLDDTDGAQFPQAIRDHLCRLGRIGGEGHGELPVEGGRVGGLRRHARKPTAHRLPCPGESPPPPPKLGGDRVPPVESPGLPMTSARWRARVDWLLSPAEIPSIPPVAHEQPPHRPHPGERAHDRARDARGRHPGLRMAVPPGRGRHGGGDGRGVRASSLGGARARGHGGPATLDARRRYATSFVGVVDLLAALPALVALVVPIPVDLFRLLRLLRLLKLARYTPALSLFAAVMRNESRPLLATLLVVAVLLVIESAIMYVLEREAQPKVFASIPHAMWWAIVTIATVGYGDMYPHHAGRQDLRGRDHGDRDRALRGPGGHPGHGVRQRDPEARLRRHLADRRERAPLRRARRVADRGDLSAAQAPGGAGPVRGGPAQRPRRRHVLHHGRRGAGGRRAGARQARARTVLRRDRHSSATRYAPPR